MSKGNKKPRRSQEDIDALYDRQMAVVAQLEEYTARLGKFVEKIEKIPGLLLSESEVAQQRQEDSILASMGEIRRESEKEEERKDEISLANDKNLLV